MVCRGKVGLLEDVGFARRVLLSVGEGQAEWGEYRDSQGGDKIKIQGTDCRRVPCVHTVGGQRTKVRSRKKCRAARALNAS